MATFAAKQPQRGRVAIASMTHSGYAMLVSLPTATAHAAATYRGVTLHVAQRGPDGVVRVANLRSVASSPSA